MGNKKKKNENPIEAEQSKTKHRTRQVRQWKTGFDCRLTLIGSTNMHAHRHKRLLFKHKEE